VTHRAVALKKCFNAFQSATDSQRTYREVMILKGMGKHENIVELQEVMRSDNSMVCVSSHCPSNIPGLISCV
jgi:mitogen-activated protein kinase 15